MIIELPIEKCFPDIRAGDDIKLRTPIENSGGLERGTVIWIDEDKNQVGIRLGYLPI